MSLEILIVTNMYPHPGHEGSGAFVMHQVEQLRALGHSVDVFHFRGYRSKLEYIKAGFEVNRRTKNKRYDVVHAHYGPAGVPALFRVGAPLVITLHGSDAQKGFVQPLISRWVSKHAQGTIVVSPDIAQKIPGRIIPCGVDLELFRPKGKSDSRKKLGLSSERKFILFPFNPRRRVKRHDLASAAVEKIRKTGIDVELLMISKASTQEMPFYYSAADAMILCSNSEGSPTAVKESLACNTPVICTDVGDTLDIVHGIDGVHVCEQTVDSLADGISRVLQRREGFTFDGRSSMQRYSQRTTVESIVTVYQEAIARFKRGSVQREADCKPARAKVPHC